MTEGRPLLDVSNWAEVSLLLDKALALPPAEREPWLRSLDGEHATHRETLRELLSHAASVETGDFLATLPRLGEPADTAALSEPAAGDSVGPYRLVRELGSGGMGSVWLAERADGALKRNVALKLPRMAWARGLAERMGRERDILATLEHPNIARLYDAGVDRHGRPFLALEYVEGRPIDVVANDRALGVDERIGLLLQVCTAVAFAHARLVVHRDLKPGNILVTAEGNVRLLDFGIAKLMQGGSAKETHLTQWAGRALTLDYASPEQIKGEPIGTASDVYSLGVVAFELLTGSRPYRLKRGSAAELEEAIAAADPPLASEAARDPQVRKALKGDLDAILNTALRKSPSARYATVDAFAQDLRATLAGRPVSARPDSLHYRLGKLLQRHRWETGIVAAVALALLGGAYAQVAVLIALGLGAGLALWQARAARQAANQASRDRDAARQDRDRANAARDFLLQLFMSVGRRDAASLEARELTAMELLERGVQQVDSLRERSPHTRNFLLHWFSHIHAQLNKGEQALQLQQRALEAEVALHGPESAAAHFALASLADRLRLVGREQEGIDTIERAIVGMRRSAPGSHNLLCTLNNHARIWVARDPQRSLRSALEAVAIGERIGDSEAETPHEHAKALIHATRAFNALGRYREGLEHAERGCAAIDRVLAPGSADGAIGMLDGVRSLVGLGRLERAAEAIAAAIAILERFPESRGRSLPSARLLFALILRDLGDRAGADAQIDLARQARLSHPRVSTPSRALIELQQAIGWLADGADARALEWLRPWAGAADAADEEPSVRLQMAGAMALLLCRTGDRPAGLDWLGRLQSLSGEVRAFEMQAWAALAGLRVHAACGQAEEFEQALRASKEQLAGLQDNRVLAARALAAEASGWLDLGRADAAWECVAGAIDGDGPAGVPAVTAGELTLRAAQACPDRARAARLAERASTLLLPVQDAASTLLQSARALATGAAPSGPGAGALGDPV